MPEDREHRRFWEGAGRAERNIGPPCSVGGWKPGAPEERTIET